ncbi:MAG: hypothetical protein ACUVX9_05840 [Anaerolineae bacterium]
MDQCAFAPPGSPARATAPSVMKYQYDQINKHLLLLQDHAAARTCPYSPAGEACIRKHLLTIEAYAEETIPMEDNPAYQAKLADLENEARARRLDEEAVICGEKAELASGLDHWARRWRKEFELHALSCEMAKSMEELHARAAEAEPVS